MTTPLTTPSLAVGVCAGIASAVLSSVSFLVSRHHGSRDRGASLRLLVLAHLLMGATCVPLAWLLWPARMPPAASWLPPLAGSTATYVLGQSLIFAALRRADASRISPLLGLKIAMLAAVSTLFLDAALDARQWVAVAFSIAAAGMLQRGGGLPRAAAGIVLLACATFACSDLCIVWLIDTLQAGTNASGATLTRLHASGLGMCITYLLCGLCATSLLALGLVRPQDRHDWMGAAQYGGTWLLGMAALYTCFGLVGAVFGNILQSTRGLMSILIGAWLAHVGWHDLETQVDRRTLVRRGLAAVLMTAAIAIYVIDLA